MAFESSVSERPVLTFGSPILVTDPYGVPAESAFLARNVTYIAEGELITRYGISEVYNPGDAISSMSSWQFINLGNPLNYLVYFKPGVGARKSPVPTPSSDTIMVQTTAVGAMFAPAGNRIFAVFYKNTGLADSGGQVYSINAGADALFRRPPLATTEVLVSFTEGAANSGNIVAGLHQVGFYLTTANGYSTRLAPLDSSINFVPQAFVASGGRNATATFTPQGGYVWPTGASITLVLTTATNLQKYITVPLLAPTFVAGSATYNIQFDVTDEDLNANGTDVTLQQFVLSQAANNDPPFLPQAIYTFGERMAMTGRDAAGVPVTYFSEPNSYQTMTAAQHGVYLPGNLIQTVGFELRGVCYLLGPHWTYSVTDSGQVPAQWADPQRVDGTIGALGPYCVWADPAMGIAWIADQGGLYTFSGGQYSRLPVSYYVSSDWNRINWTDPTKIFVVDNKDQKVIRVIAPLDTATTPSHVMSFYYTDGVTPDLIKYTLDDYGTYGIGAGTLIQETAKRYNVWYGPSSAGSVVRVNTGDETHPYRDLAAAIDCRYRLGLVPGVGPSIQKSTVNEHHGDRIRVTGLGHLNMTVYSLDNTKSVVPRKMPLAIVQNPGYEYMIRYAIQSEQVAIELTNNAELDSYFKLSMLTHFYTLGAAQR